MECPLVKCLAEELRACPAPVHPMLLAAVSLELGGALISFTLASQRSNQSRRHSRTGTRKRFDQRVIGVRSGKLVDLLVVSSNRHQKLLQETCPRDGRPSRAKTSSFKPPKYVS